MFPSPSAGQSGHQCFSVQRNAEPFADDTVAGIAALTELASTALANNELREQAHQQSELRKVAEIAAAGADPLRCSPLSSIPRQPC